VGKAYHANTARYRLTVTCSLQVKKTKQCDCDIFMVSHTEDISDSL